MPLCDPICLVRIYTNRDACVMRDVAPVRFVCSVAPADVRARERERDGRARTAKWIADPILSTRSGSLSE